jgi:hypothetical protein
MIDYIYVKRMFLARQIDLYSDCLIDYCLRLDHLTRVAWALEQRSRSDEETRQIATTKFASD